MRGQYDEIDRIDAAWLATAGGLWDAREHRVAESERMYTDATAWERIRHEGRVRLAYQEYEDFMEAAAGERLRAMVALAETKGGSDGGSVRNDEKGE